MSGASLRPSISADGRWVAFDSGANNLVYYGLAGFPSGSPSEVYSRDTLTCATSLVSLVAPSTAMAAPGASGPSVSDDGRYVVFFCSGTVCGAGSSGFNNVVRYDRDTTVTAALSVSGTTTPTGSSFLPSVSGDGRYVAFPSDNLTLGSCSSSCVTQVYLSDSDVGGAGPWAWQARPSGIVGGGFVNTVAVDATGTYAGRVAVGGDVSGVHVSTNSGDSWTPSNTNAAGYTPKNYNNTFSSLAWSPDGGTLFGLTGNGLSGALVGSSDGGATWTSLNTGVVGSGGGTHPRPTGQLFDTALYASNLLFVGTSTGLFQYTTTTMAATKIWPPSGTSAQITGVAADPATSSTVYVSVASGAKQELWR